MILKRQFQYHENSLNLKLLLRWTKMRSHKKKLCSYFCLSSFRLWAYINQNHSNINKFFHLIKQENCSCCRWPSSLCTFSDLLSLNDATFKLPQTYSSLNLNLSLLNWGPGIWLLIYPCSKTICQLVIQTIHSERRNKVMNICKSTPPTLLVAQLTRLQHDDTCTNVTRCFFKLRFELILHFYKKENWLSQGLDSITHSQEIWIFLIVQGKIGI